MAVKTTGLGKGFDALIPQNFDSSLLVDKSERVQKLFITEIEPNPHQPRQHFDEAALNELAASIKQYGILQPLVVRPNGEDKYTIIAGERRWRAARKAGLKSVPAIVRTTKELEQLEIALVENVQREDLSPLEQAVSIQKLHEQFNLDYASISKRLGKATTTIQNIARLLQLPQQAREALHQKRITEGHARAILALKDTKRQKELLELIQKHGWSVRQAERFVTAHKEGLRSTKQVEQRVQTKTPETQQLAKMLRTPVSVRRTAKGGKIEITFKNDADLKRIITKISQSL